MIHKLGYLSGMCYMEICKSIELLFPSTITISMEDQSNVKFDPVTLYDKQKYRITYDKSDDDTILKIYIGNHLIYSKKIYQLHTFIINIYDIEIAEHVLTENGIIVDH